MAIASAAASARANADNASEPLAPYSSDAPISNVAEAAPPSTKYLSAASALSRPPEGEEHQDVDGQRHQLEPEEQRQEAVGGQQQADAVERGKQQHMEPAPRLKSSRERRSTGTASANTMALASKSSGVTEYCPGNGDAA